MKTISSEQETQNKGLLQKLQEWKEKVSILQTDLEKVKKELNNVQEVNGALTVDLEKAKETYLTVVSELEGSKKEENRALEKVSQLEAENCVLTNQIQTDQLTFMEKMTAIQDMEQMVQSKLTEVERMREQLMLEREVAQYTSPVSFLTRKRSPYAKRLTGIAGILEKGETNKALQLLESLMVELKVKSTGANSKSAMSSEVLVVEDEPPEVNYHELVIPMKPYLTHATHEGGCSSCASFLNGSMLATAGIDKRVILWDPATIQVQGNLGGVSETIMDVNFTCNGDAVLGGSADKSVSVWNTSSKKRVHVMTGHTKGINCVACDPADPYRAASSGEDRHIRFWDVKRGFQITDRKISLEEYTNAICYTANGSVAAGSIKGGVKLWDIHSAELWMEHEHLHHDMIIGLYSFPFSSHFLLSAGKDNTVKIFDFRNQQVVKNFSCAGFSLGTMGYMGKGKCCLGISRDERFICAGTTSGAVLVWKNFDTGNKSSYEILKTDHHQDSVVATVWCDKNIFSCDKAGKIVVWH